MTYSSPLALDEIGERQFTRNEMVCTCLSRGPYEGGHWEIIETEDGAD